MSTRNYEVLFVERGVADVRACEMPEAGPGELLIRALVSTRNYEVLFVERGVADVRACEMPEAGPGELLIRALVSLLSRVFVGSGEYTGSIPSEHWIQPHR